MTLNGRRSVSVGLLWRVLKIFSKTLLLSGFQIIQAWPDTRPKDASFTRGGTAWCQWHGRTLQRSLLIFKTRTILPKVVKWIQETMRVREHIPHTWASSCDNLFQSNFSAWSNWLRGYFRKDTWLANLNDIITLLLILAADQICKNLSPGFSKRIS